MKGSEKLLRRWHTCWHLQELLNQPKIPKHALGYWKGTVAVPWECIWYVRFIRTLSHKDMPEFADSFWIYTWQTLITREGFFLCAIVLPFGLPRAHENRPLENANNRSGELWIDESCQTSGSNTHEELMTVHLWHQCGLWDPAYRNTVPYFSRNVTICYRSTCWEGKRNNLRSSSFPIYEIDL